MPLIGLPKELLGVLVRNPDTGGKELPADATEAQRKAFTEHRKRVEKVQKSRVTIIE